MKCWELKYLDIGSINHQIYYFPEARLRLETLYELRCDTSIDYLYFYGLARLCQYIQRVIINNVNINTNHGIVKLIEVQKNLKYFEWIDDLDECYDIRVDPYKEILLALGKNADTINHLELFFLYSDRTPPKVYPKFHKVKTLIINYFGSLNEEQLKMCIYHDLEVLKIGHYDLNAASIIIENSGRNLKKIYLEFCIYYDYYDNFNEHSHILIRKIHENCPSIKYLSLIFPPSKQHFNEFEILLQMCQNLKSLLLIIFMNKIRNEEKHLEYGEELLKILIRSSHNNLREIRFLYVKFSLESLEEFFEKWRGRPALSIVTCNRIYKEDNYVKLINRYKNNGVIKDFIYESHYNILNMDFKI
ncbi:9969_t:CDS:2 [Rhizophagus irregularis]|nr:9969_t:CDS:2 [Rhizophagus irregularis]